jgi:hypothetical protein
MKTPHRSTKPKKVSIDHPKPEPDIISTWRQIPLSEAIVEKWTQDLRDFPTHFPEATSITDFINSKEIYHQQYYRLVNKYPLFKLAHEHTREVLGQRLWHNSVTRKYDWKAAHYMLHTYGQKFKDADRYHMELAKEKNDELAKSLVSGIVHSNKDKIHDSNT